MTVRVAENAGFCFGVKRATDELARVLGQVEPSGSPAQVFLLGELIHNPTYNAEMANRGVRTISFSELDRIRSELEAGHDCYLITRAHGILKNEEETVAALAAQYPDRFHVSDCTCPFVRSIHKIADERSGPDVMFLVLGAKDHPEVAGIVSHVNGPCRVLADAGEAQRFADEIGSDDRPAVLVAQTTQRISEWEKTQKILKKVYTNLSIFDTICIVTEKRQQEAERLAEESDVMIVIGGRNSSNTAKLYEICRSHCREAVWIETAAELPVREYPSATRIGIAAGASTPDRIIQEVQNTMSEETKTENFEELLESSFKTLNTGDTVVGTVIAITPTEVQLDLGAKVTGTIAQDQITDDPNAKLDEMFKIGDEIEAFVIRVSDVEGIAALSKKRIDSRKDWNKLVAACESGEILEGRIISAVKGGVLISLFSNSVFIPASHTGTKADTDLQTLVGTTQKVKIIEIKEERHRAYASIRNAAREERRAAEEKIWSEIEVGKHYDGVVKSLTSYGAFVDIGGVDGMVHNTELSWKRIKNPAEIVKVGDCINVYVKALDPERKRISLGYKKEEDDPWFIFNQTYKENQIATVKIANFTPFGAFAEVVPGVDGLIHISQIADHKIATPGEVLEIGQTVDALITSIDQERRKVNLSIRALLEPADVEEAAAPAEDAADEDVAVYSSDDPSASTYVAEGANE